MAKKILLVKNRNQGLKKGERFLTQADEPAAGTGATQCDTSELVIWKDSDDNKIYICFNDGGTVKTVEAA